MFCVTVSYGCVRGEARQYPYWQPALYQAVKLKDGRYAWKYVKHLGIARRSPVLTKEDIRKLPYLYKKRVRNYHKLNLSESIWFYFLGG